jgi:hypothetical protein
MNRILALTFLASLAGCGTPEDDSSDEIVTSLDNKSDSFDAARNALPAGAQHIYFTQPLSAYASDDQPLSYSYFLANPKQEFTVSVAEQVDGRPVAGEHIGFKLQRAVKKNGKYSWTVVDQAESDSGEAGLSFKPRIGPSLYLITATASPLPAQLTVVLKCAGTGCALEQQPGELCGTRGVGECDDGLFCSYSLESMCGAADQGGTCSVKPQICNKIYHPTCGCDGHTYGNNCEANAGGTSVSRVGSCDVNIVGAWSYIKGAHYDYTFNADGTFQSLNQPACAFGNPRCYVKIAPGTGVYNVGPTSIFLTYTSDFRNGENAELTFNKKQTHLTGSDWNTKLDLTRVK